MEYLNPRKIIPRIVSLMIPVFEASHVVIAMAHIKTDGHQHFIVATFEEM